MPTLTGIYTKVFISKITYFTSISDGAKWEVRFPNVPISITPYKQTADLRCKVKTGTFVGFYYADGQKIEKTDGKINIQDEIVGNETTMILEIVDVREQDYGFYICRDNTGSDNVTLEVSRKLMLFFRRDFFFSAER